MPTEPVFVTSRDDLKSRLRMSSAYKQDTESVIDDAMLQVRGWLYGKLGSSRIEELEAITANETNPTNTNELLRANANLLEVKWVKLVLLRELPTLFFDASAQSLELWNEEPLSRNSPAGKEIERLQAEIDALLSEVSKDSIDEDNGIRVSSIGPATTPARPFGSIY